MIDGRCSTKEAMRSSCEFVFGDLCRLRHNDLPFECIMIFGADHESPGLIAAVPGSCFRDILTAVTRQSLYWLYLAVASVVINELDTTSTRPVGAFVPTVFCNGERKWHGYSGVLSSPCRTAVLSSLPS